MNATAALAASDKALAELLANAETELAEARADLAEGFDAAFFRDVLTDRISIVQTLREAMIATGAQARLAI